MKKMKSILTLTIMGGAMILTGCSGNSQSTSMESNNQPTIQFKESTTSTEQSNTQSKSTVDYGVDITSLEKDIKVLLEGEYNGKWEQELNAKYGYSWDEAMEAKYGDDFDDIIEAKMTVKLNEGTTREDLIKSIESDLSQMIKNKELPVNWEEQLEAKYGDEWDDLMEAKYGDDWDDLFQAEFYR